MRMSKGHVAVNMGMYLFCIPFQIDTDAGGKRYIISVITITDIGEGKIIPSTGQAKFKTRYTAIVMKPFKGEVVDAKVVNVNKASLAMISLYFSTTDSLWQMGFFAMVGPLQVFVSCHVSRKFSIILALFPLLPPNL